MHNIRLSHLHHWKSIPYGHIPDFPAFYDEDKSNLAYFSDWDKILKCTRATGYEGIELLPWDLGEILAVFGSLPAFRDFVEARGLCVSGMFHALEGARFPANHPRLLEQTRQAALTVRTLGGQHLNVCPESDWHLTGGLSDEELAGVAACLNVCGRAAADQGLLLGIHTEFSCAVNRENHRRLLEKTDPRFVHHCLDTAPIAMMGEDIAAFYADYHDRICAIHLKDTWDPDLPAAIRHGSVGMIPDDGHRWFWEPGMGVLDFPALWRQLKRYGFRGWVSVETDGTPDLLASMALSSYYVQTRLAPIYI